MKRLRQFHCSAAWPPPVLVALFVFVYLFFILGIWFISRSVPANLASGVLDSEDNARFFAAAIGAGAVFHVLCRLVRFHPACSPAYASWLALSPWTSAKPLPLGPIHPVWQDAAVLAILAALARWHAHIDPALPLEAAAMTYLIGLTLLLGVTATWPFFMATAFLWPSILLTDETWRPLTAIFIVMAVVLWVGSGKSLKAFPWRQENRTHPGLSRPPGANSMLQMEIRVDGVNAAGTASTVGWAFAQLSPKARFKSVSNATSFWVSLLIGWWAYCLMVGNDTESAPGLILGCGIIGALTRLGIYWGGLSPSFSFRSRVFTGRLIVPGFDQIFVVPLTAIVVAVVGGIVTVHAGAWYPVAHAVSLALIWFILLAGGPTMRNWVLTGEHRFHRRFTGGTSRQSFRPV